MPDGRPERFSMNGGHPLAQGLVFAGLGELPNSTYFHDSSLYRNSGTLTNMAVPATATSGWAWDNYLRRMVMLGNFQRGNSLSRCPPQQRHK